MASKEVSEQETDSFKTINVSNVGFSKLVFLRRSIIDNDCACEKIRRLINSINEEMFIANEQIRGLLAANQKRLEVLKDAREKMEKYETAKLLNYEEFVSIINLDEIYANSVFTIFNNVDLKDSRD